MQPTDECVQSPASCLEFAVTGDLSAMVAARDRILDFVHDQGVAEPEEIDILVALQEALANAVLHGCGNDPSKVIGCSVSVDAEAVTIVIKDPGQGFNTAGTSDITDEGTNLSEHGRGIHLIRSLMDEVSYRQRGAEVTLKKLRTRAA